MRRWTFLTCLALAACAPASNDGDGSDPPPTAEEAARSAREAALAIGIPESSLADARWARADGMPAPSAPSSSSAYHRGHAVLGELGPALLPTSGDTLLVLSTGTAAKGDDPRFQYNFSKGYPGTTPAGFPKESPSCPGVVSDAPFDDVALEVTLRPPPSARGFSFDFAFLTFEWPVYVCTRYNDFFVAMVDPILPGQADGNISFDALGNPISVNAAFLDHCSCPGGGSCPTPPGVGAKTYACGHGSALLDGTLFAHDAMNSGWSHGSTGWLRTSAPIPVGSGPAIRPEAAFTLRFAAWDASDPWLDTTIIVDGFTWIYDVDVGVVTAPVDSLDEPQ